MSLQRFNAVALVAILGLATWGAVRSGPSIAPAGDILVASSASSDGDGPGVLQDARGQAVPAGDYRRIVSLNTVADPILLSLIEPQRLVAVSTQSRDQHPEGFRYAGRPGVARAEDLEAILALQPDLVVASKFADEAFMQRLRDEGVPVFDLGDLRGVGTTVLNIRTLGQLVQQPDRAAQVESDYLLRLAALDAAVPDEAAAPGLYVSIYGDSLYGGTAGSSYADLLHYGGVRDLAAEHGHTEWPTYSPEQLLSMNPPLLVTHPGMGALLCGHTTLQHLAACTAGGRVVEVPGAYHSDPGLGLVQGAAAVLSGVHPDRVPTNPSRAPSVQVLQDRGVWE